MPFKLPQSFKLAALGVVSAVAYGSAGIDLLYPQGLSLPEAPNELATLAVKQPLSAEEFRQKISTYSKDNMMVVLLRRDACPSCEEVTWALMESRSLLMKKTGAGFTIYELNATQNPEAAALLQQRDPMAEARLHVFYNGEKIHESTGISTEVSHIADYIEMAHALAVGQVSVLDKYVAPVKTAQIFTPNP